MEQRSARTTEHERRDARGSGQVRAVRKPVGPAEEPRLPGPARGPAAARSAEGNGEGEPSPRTQQSPRPSRHTGGSALSRVPAPRLTGLGAGVFATVLMCVAGGLEGLLFGSAPAFYGTCFVLVCVASALWVRPRELFAAPVAAPLAYTVGLFFAGGPGAGVSGVLQDVFTGLALHAVWLYAGTVTAALIVVVRKAVLSALRRNAKKAQHRSRAPQDPGRPSGRA